MEKNGKPSCNPLFEKWVMVQGVRWCFRQATEGRICYFFSIWVKVTGLPTPSVCTEAERSASPPPPPLYVPKQNALLYSNSQFFRKLCKNYFCNKFVNIATGLPSWNTSSRKIIEVKFLKIQFFIHK